MKRNKILILSGALAVLLSTSCEKKLNLLPQQDLAESSTFSSTSTAFGALMGVYSTAQDYNVYGSLPQIIGDYMADNVDFVGSFPTLQDINNFVTLSDNSSVSAIWRVHYQMITQANKVIARIPSVAGFTDAQKKQYVAEAKYLRALAYLQLVDLFAQPYQFSNGTNLGVPLITDEFTGDITYPARATVNEIHAQIKKDLTEAIPDLPVSYSSASDTRGRATKGAAYGLLSRLALYRGEWADAETNARSTIAQGIYNLASDYSFYDGNTDEDVFSIENSAIDNGRTGSGGWASYYTPGALGGRGDCPYTDDLINAYGTSDLRFTSLTLTGNGADGISHTFTTKFPDAVNNSDNSPVMRTTEIYLNLAEALAQQSATPSVEATNIVNMLRTRAGLPTVITYLTKQAQIDAILVERRKELAFEGHRRMDLLRYKLPLRAGVAAAAFGADKTILPIPQREIDNNKSLVQNPGF